MPGGCAASPDPGGDLDLLHPLLKPKGLLLDRQSPLVCLSAQALLVGLGRGTDLVKLRLHPPGLQCQLRGFTADRLHLKRELVTARLCVGGRGGTEAAEE